MNSNDKKVFSIALAASLLFSSNLISVNKTVSVFAASSDSIFASDTKQNESEPQYFKIDVGIAQTTKNNDLWNIDLSSSIILTQDTEKPINLIFSVNRLSDDRYQLDSIDGYPKKQSVQLTKEEGFYFNETVSGLNTGQYEAIFKVVSEQDENYIWANQAQLLFTVTEKGIELDWKDDYIPSFAPSQSQPAETNKVISVTPETAPYIRHDSQEYVEGDDLLVDQVSDNSIMATSTLTGNWKFYTKSGTKNIRNAKVELKYRDQFYIWRSVGSTYTNAAGNFSFSYTPPNANYWELIIYPQSTFTTVKNPNDGNSVWKSNIFYSDLSTGGNVNLTLTNGTSVNNAFYVYDDIVTHKNFLLVD